MTAVGLLTVSTQCARGTAVDTSGPALEKLLLAHKHDWTVAERQIVGDDKAAIASTVRRWSQQGCQLIIVSGGTGISADDVTVEAIEPLFSKRLPALATAMTVGSLGITPFAALSQVAAGVAGGALVLAVPGSRKGAVENVQQILDVLPHAVDTAAATGGTRHLHKEGGHVACGCARPGDLAGDGSAQGLSNELGAGVARRARASPYPMVAEAAALERVLACVDALPVRRVGLAELAPGHVLAEDVAAQENVPGYRASVMDGYAMIAADGPGVFAVQAAMTAGMGSAPELQPGTVVRVATGAPVPPGADAVVMVEDTELVSEAGSGEEREVRIRPATIVAGQNIRPVGHDLRAGAIVARAGARITAVGGEIGTLAISGNRDFAVYAMPRIAVMSTGDEVVDVLGARVPAALAYGAIRDSNRPALLAALRALGCAVEDLGVVRDEPDVLAQTIRDALRSCDGVVSTGGVSMGERDWLKPVVEQRLGGEIQFGRVLMKPSKPTTFATVPLHGHTRFVFALPGNPVSALVAFHMFVAPAIRKLAGHLASPGADAQILRPQVSALFDEAEPVVLDRVRPEYVRALLVWDHARSRWTVRLTDRGQQSSRMASMQSANALVALPVGTEQRRQIARGDTVTAIVIGTPQF
ncbi:hypothetical protein H4S01_003019 [Coemansia sp. RSA 2610]|nr:hypothetical protein H4S01_003019 [Coemansia sp. RSA 2610]